MAAVREILVEFGVVVDQKELIQLQNNVNRAVIRFAQLRRIAGFALAALGVGAITDSADELISYQNRLQSVTSSLEEYQAAEQGVIDVSRRSLSSVKDTAAVYQRYAQVTDHLNLTQDELLQFTESLTKAMKLGGSSAAEARGALIQLGQGLGNDFKSGGQELNSIIEQAPKLANILAKAAGGTRGELKDLARAGKLSGKVVVKAITDATAEIDADFKKRKMTFDDLSTLMETEWLVLLKQFMPLIEDIVKALLRGVEAFRGWVERGEAFNSVLAAATVVTLALSYAMGGLLLKVLALSAPFLLIFGIVEDFVAFMRGQKSVIGYLLADDDEDQLRSWREAVKEAWELAKGFFKLLTDPNGDNSHWRAFFKFLTGEIDKMFDHLLERFSKVGDDIRRYLRKNLGETLSDALGIEDPGKEGTRKKRMRAEVRMETKEDEAFNSIGDVGFGKNTGSTALDRAITGALTPVAQLNPMQAMTVGRSGGEANPLAGNSLVLNTSVTVNGNVDEQLARSLAKDTAKETAATLGRDKSALGASVGLQ